MYMAKQLVWAEELWGAQTESVVLVVDKKLELAEEEGNLQAMVKKPERRLDVWLALRYLCTFHGCTNDTFLRVHQVFRARWRLRS